MMGVLAAARVGGLDVIDAVYNDIAGRGGVRGECLLAADYGFDGKTVIHPAQIEAANRASRRPERDRRGGGHRRAVRQARES